MGIKTNLKEVFSFIYKTNFENGLVEYEYDHVFFGKYNSENNDTIFSKNVVIEYLDNRITSDYADFSIGRNSMIISKNVVYTNLENILRADVMEMNIETKDTKIFMYEKEKKVNIKNRY